MAHRDPALFAREPRKRAIQRRMVREADDYLADVGTRFATGAGLGGDGRETCGEELALWEDAATGDYLTGDLSAVDLTVYPLMALLLRIAGRRPDFVKDDFIGPQSFGLDRSHAGAPDRPAHLAAALERGRFGLTAGGASPMMDNQTDRADLNWGHRHERRGRDRLSVRRRQYAPRQRPVSGRPARRSSRAPTAIAPARATGRFSRSCAANWATPTISARSSA